MYSKAWLLFVMALLQSAYHCDSAFPRSDRGDPGGGVIVQLYRWRFDDIARECEQYLAPKGYGGVEVAPITEHWVLSGNPRWDEPYYPVSYKILSRSGDEKSFIEMVQRCNKAGIKVYVSVVLAYMPSTTTGDLLGFGGSKANGSNYDYPAVPYNESDFTKPQCFVRNTEDTTQMRSCDMPSDHHLNHTSPKVRQTLRDFLNKLISFGVAGFSIDAVNRIHPDHLRAIFSRLRYLNTSHGFACESEPYIYQEYDSIKVSNDKAAWQYYALGRLADYKYRRDVNSVFLGSQPVSILKDNILVNGGIQLLPDDKALVFIDSQAAQKQNAQFQMLRSEWRQLISATGFMLACPFGQPRIASSFVYYSVDDPPPIKDNLIAPVNCAEGKWECEHKWGKIERIMNFRNVVGDAKVTNIWSDGYDNLAFSRGDKGFVMFSSNYYSGNRDFNFKLQTGLPKGEYCDVIVGTLMNNKCTASSISVDDKGFATVSIQNRWIGMIAFHVEAKLK